MQILKNKLHPPLLESRHYPSGNNGIVEMGKTPFAAYVAQSREMLRKFHSKKNHNNLDNVVDGNAPFELKPAVEKSSSGKKPFRRGVLLTHGLSDSPYFMRHLGAFFQENGFRVMAILLPGHGTQPGDLLDVSWEEWAESVAYGVEMLAEEVDEVYLGGFSAGGALSVYQSLQDKRVCGLFLFSPAFRISPRAAFARFRRIYNWLIPSGKWLELKPDNDIYKYESFPINAVEQIYALTNKLSKLLHQFNVEIPVFAAASADDVTVISSATLDFMAHTRHPASKLLLYCTDNRSVSPNLQERDYATWGFEGTNKLEIVNSVFPEQRILSFSHTSLVLPADDEHYGESGDYSNCLHYYPDDVENYLSCNNNPLQVWQGEVTEKNLKVGIVRRLMYNPDFSGLKVSMRKFINDLQ